MNAARPTDGLLPRLRTLALIAAIEQSPGRSMEQVLKDFAAIHPGLASRTHNTLLSLIEGGFVLAETDGGPLALTTSCPRDAQARAQAIASLTAARLARRLSDAQSSACLQSKDREDGLWLDRMCIPGPSDGIALWIDEFGVAPRGELGSRFWRVASAYETMLLDGARVANRRRVRRTMSSAQLKAKLEQNALDGAEAENWVVSYEKQRLRGHLLIEQVRRVSDENVAEGYDIASFSSHRTLSHDRFIEVKSYSGAKHFHWSRNEIVVAEELGEDYCLYLVDRDRMSEPGYVPQIIEGPTMEVFTVDGSGWTVEPTSYEFSETSGTRKQP